MLCVNLTLPIIVKTLISCRIIIYLALQSRLRMADANLRSKNAFELLLTSERYQNTMDIKYHTIQPLYSRVLPVTLGLVQVCSQKGFVLCSTSKLLVFPEVFKLAMRKKMHSVILKIKCYLYPPLHHSSYCTAQYCMLMHFIPGKSSDTSGFSLYLTLLLRMLQVKK